MSANQSENLAKGKFADHIGVSAGRISQLIASGQISKDAIVGNGRMAKINVERAMADLDNTLDLSQRLGNGAGTKIETSKKPTSEIHPVDDEEIGGDETPRALSTSELYAQEKLKTAQSNNRRLKEQELQRRGIYTLTSEVEIKLTQATTAMLRSFEGGLVEMANDLSEKFGLQNRDVIHALRKSFFEFRKSMATDVDAVAEQMPKTVEDDSGIEGFDENRQGEA